jgi:hypothetical protein
MQKMVRVGLLGAAHWIGELYGLANLPYTLCLTLPLSRVWSYRPVRSTDFEHDDSNGAIISRNGLEKVSFSPNFVYTGPKSPETAIFGPITQITAKSLHFTYFSTITDKRKFSTDHQDENQCQGIDW